MKMRVPVPRYIVAGVLSIACLLAVGGTSAQAPSQLFSLEGQTPQASYEGESRVKLSLMDWSDDEASSAVLEAFEQWQEDGDHQAFHDLLREQKTLGYLFTGEVTGYSVKYAFKGEDDHSALLIVPGLKSKDPHMWKAPPADGAPPFTLLELEWEEPDERATLNVSDIAMARLNEDGSALVIDREGNEFFAEMKDATPYYLKDPS